MRPEILRLEYVYFSIRQRSLYIFTLFSATNITASQYAMHFKAICEGDCHLNKATYIKSNWEKNGEKKEDSNWQRRLETIIYWYCQSAGNLHWKFLRQSESDKLWTMWQIIHIFSTSFLFYLCIVLPLSLYFKIQHFLLA